MNEFTENELVQKTTVEYLRDSLGWEIHFAYNTEIFGENGTFGRKNDKEVLLRKHFFSALIRLNPGLPEEAYHTAFRKISESVVGRSLEQINQENYHYLLDGVPVEFQDATHKFVKRNLRIIDFNHPENNHYLAVREFWIRGSLYHRRADIVGFINGIPLIFFELKNIYKDIRSAYENNLKDYKQSVPQLFYHNAIIVLSNGIDAKIGSITSKFEHFHEWKRFAENETGRVDMETLLKGVFRKETLLDILENFILFDESGGKIVKILAKNHQFLGVNLAVNSVLNRKEQNGKLGVFWHTQGSGKSYSMVFLTQKIHRKIGRNFTFLICTDREDLDTQIYKTFAGVGLVEHDKDPCRADSGENLKQMLKEHKSYIFSLIQKFNQEVNEKEPYNTRDDIIVITDEAHRTQYGLLALNLRNALPNASYIGFTGTPLFKDDEITRKVFGEYVSTYDFQRAIDDKATVPLYFDARGEHLGISILNLNEKIAAKLEEMTGEDINERLKLEKELSRDYHIITASKRLDSIAIDFAEHYSKAWESGKAMFVCIDKLTCVRMYNLVGQQWEEQKKKIRNLLENSSDEQEEVYRQRQLDWMEETRMAVVVSEEQNEEEKFNKWNLSILTHRKLMKEGFLQDNGKRMNLETAFKDPEHPFRVVFVCAMWLTGFDVPSLSTLYLDKPLKAHTLMQAIARANRVYEGKSNGLIVDYVGILKNLRDALITFAKGEGSDGVGGETPAPPQEELLKKLNEALNMMQNFLMERGFQLQTLLNVSGFDKLQILKLAKEAINENSENRRRFEILSREFFKLFKACINHKEINQYRNSYDAINTIYKSLQGDREKADISKILKELQDIVNQSVGVLKAKSPESRLFDISKIDFNLLQESFKKSQTKKTTVQNLQDAVEKKLKSMMEQNPTRINLLKKYQDIIEEYNNEKKRKTIEDTFRQFIEFIEEMDEEDYRAEREGMNQESLALYDVLSKTDLAGEEKNIVKNVARSLFSQLEDLIGEINNWKSKQSTRDLIKSKIRDFLWDDKSGLPNSYSDEDIDRKTEEIFIMLASMSES